MKYLKKSMLIGLAALASVVATIAASVCYGDPEPYVCLAAGTPLNVEQHYCWVDEDRRTCQSMWITEGDALCVTSPTGSTGYYARLDSYCFGRVYVTVQTCDENCNATIIYHQGPVTVMCTGSVPDTAKPGCMIVMAPVQLPSYYCLAFL